MPADIEPPKFAPGVKVWITDNVDAWVEAIVTKQEGDKVSVRRVGDKGEDLVLKASECFAKEDEGKGVDDMTKLSYLHEPGVLQNLLKRYKLNQIYTYTGSILIAVNPFTRLPGLYDSIMKAQYQGARIGDLAPHVFAIADTAYRAMLDEKKSQSILISGESGAGKTETTKLVMEYLAGVGGRTSKDRTNVETQVLESNPILEAFGNAKTVRNNNSSRFGKFIEIQFDKKGRVSGAAIKSYLLERSRVVQIKDPERNYHCFYQLCYGASQEEAEKYMLTSRTAEDFHYLNQSKCFELGGKESNAEEYRSTRRAMNVLGFSMEEQSSIFAIVAAILHLGNVEFTQKDVGNSTFVSEGDPLIHLQCVADLLRVDKAELEDSLCTVKRKVAGEILPSPLDPKSAAAKRDSLAKKLYSTMFDWIVAKINESIGVDEEAEAFIGVLDIYGFEHFEKNSFEQFCINLANEKLQQHFNQHVLKMEQEEYEREQINWSRIPFADNQDVLDIIEKDQGILSLLDSACKLTSTTAESFTLNLVRNFQQNKRFTKSKISKFDFTLEHYAGKVKYSTDEFISKNSDAVVIEHHTLLSNSLDPFISSLFPKDKISSKSNKFVSLGNSFKLQLEKLMTTLNKTEPHYIRCVKPNTKLKPHIFEKALVMTQLRSGGVLEAVRMCSAGYPTRKTFEDFIERFSLLAPGEMDFFGEEKENVVKILQQTGLEDYQIGLTKVFLRAGQMVILETMKTEKMTAAAKTIQRNVRAFLFKRHREKAVKLLQTSWRGYNAVQKYNDFRIHWAAIVVQKNAKATMQRKRFVALKCAAIITQTLWRTRLSGSYYENFRESRAALTIQRIWRGYKSRKPLNELRRFVRGRMARKKLAKMKRDAALRDDLVHQANEANKRAAEATSKALAGSLRFMVIQKLKEKSDKTRKEALHQLSLAQKEIDELKSALNAKENQVLDLQEALSEAQSRANFVSESLQNAIQEKTEILEQFQKKQTTVSTETPRSSTTPKISPKLFPVQEAPVEPEESKLPPQAPVEETLVSSEIKVSQSPRGEASRNKLPRPLKPEVPLQRTLESRSLINQEIPLALPLLDTKRSIGRSFSMASRSGSRGLGAGRGFNSPPSTPLAGTPRGGDGEAFNKLAHSLQMETEAARKLRQENHTLRDQMAELEGRVENSLKEIENLKEAKERVHELLSMKESELKEMERRVIHERTLGKEALEQEVKVLSNRILALTAVNKPQLPPDKQQEVLLRVVGNENLGYSPQGYPVAAVILYKTLVHWKTFEAEKTNTFDRIIETLQQAENSATDSDLCYLITNTVWLYFLVQNYRPPAPSPQSSGGGFLFFGGSPTKPRNRSTEIADTSVFKFQLASAVERLYLKIIDSATDELKSLFSGPSAGSAIHNRGMAMGVESPRGGSSGIPRTGTLAKRHTVNYWNQITVVISGLVDTLQFNNVPPLIIQGILKQLLAFVDMKIFNSLMLRSQWCPCTYTNGELMRQGLMKLLGWLEGVQYWLADALGHQVEPLHQELCHVSQAVEFLVMDHKAQRSLEDIFRLCPDLSIDQLAELSRSYEDDRYGTQGFTLEVIDKLCESMSTDSNLLKDESKPFRPEDVLFTLASFDLNEVEPPPTLVRDASFIFLLPDHATTSRMQSFQRSLWGDSSSGFLKPLSSRRFDPEHNVSRRRSYEPPPK